ncbi:MAG TPA: DUF1905 domain-containing protein [Bacteroidota bacterium]
MIAFSGIVRKIGINPYMTPPQSVLRRIFKSAGKDKGPVPVRGTLNGKPFRQTLVRYQGAWRLYLNTPMRVNAGVDVGDRATVRIAFDSKPREVPMHPLLNRALARNARAKVAFEALAPSRRKEILRYLHSMKNGESAERNVRRVIAQLIGRTSEAANFLVRR